MKKFNKISLVTSLVVSLVLSLVGPVATRAAATAPSLGDAASFSVLGAAAMSSANITTISGDLGLSPGLAASKTGTWTHTGGADYFGTGGLSASAQTAALNAYNNLVAQTTTGAWGTNPWSPLPGVWTDASSPTFTGTIYLNGDYSDVWVFKISTDFTFSGNVVLQGNAQACNVFWSVAGDATIGSGSNFVGTLIAQNDITSASGATINGRIISLSGTTIAMNGANSSISGPTCVAAPATPTSSGSRDGTINVVKVVVNDNGGTKTISDFPLFVSGTSVVSGVTNNFARGDGYYITETSDTTKYTRTISGDCDPDGRVNVGSGENKYCIVTNNDIGAPVVVPPVPPIIDVVKVPAPLSLPAGPGAVTYTYTLRNIGTVPVTNITMVGDTCSPIVLASGDTNANAKLEVNETWVYKCSTTLAATHTNTVVATGWANGISATDIASATVVVGTPIIPPLIHVTKVPSPLTLPAGGGIVTYTKKVTNPGTVALSNVRLTDDKCAAVTYISGDTNGNSKLENVETWTYTCKTNLTQTTTNTVTASGDANGLTARDFAIAHVIVATAVPALPKTGIFPEGNNFARNIAILAGIFALVSLSFVALKKRAI